MTGCLPTSTTPSSVWERTHEARPPPRREMADTGLKASTLEPCLHAGAGALGPRALPRIDGNVDAWPGTLGGAATITVAALLRAKGEDPPALGTRA
jgi:hypothetical protein